ncbi:hypothetical protein CEXT_114931 [Caerostris extrusa]|uniref:Uncharacterized protein n=1 Tax=Caerostris extrusa TaxID=172846 RepID=A0AAV4SM77_CAEEX|nr:hypothetical protein CEXT_114931 [Caerostris extrusa]
MSTCNFYFDTANVCSRNQISGSLVVSWSFPWRQSGYIFCRLETVLGFFTGLVVNPAPFPNREDEVLFSRPLTTRKDYVGTILSHQVTTWAHATCECIGEKYPAYHLRVQGKNYPSCHLREKDIQHATSECRVEEYLAIHLRVHWRKISFM